MKAYFFVEGAQTEKQLYHAWLSYCFPHLAEVKQPVDLTADTYILVSGKGYPAYLDRIPLSLEDAARAGVDHLFICIDAEEMSYEERRAEVHAAVNAATATLLARGILYSGQTHVVVATCCIESWLLGHRKLVPRRPPSKTLAEFKQFHDVVSEDPEQMSCPPGYLTKASFHLAYLKEVFRHHGKAYSKTRPGMATEANYLAALRDRCLDTSSPVPHLASFRVLWDVWSAMGARTQVEKPLAEAGH